MSSSTKPPDDGVVPPASSGVVRIEAPVDIVHLAHLLDAFMRAATPSDGRRILEQHPELLSDDVWWMTGRLLETGRDAGDAEMVYVLHERRRVLKRCREVGVAAALSELGY
jgi:hypothetical protein